MEKLINEVQKLQNWVKIHKKYPAYKLVKSTKNDVIAENTLKGRHNISWSRFIELSGYTKKYLDNKNIVFFKCKQCGKPNRNKIFCSTSCGSKWNNVNLDRSKNEETRKKISESHKKKYPAKKPKLPRKIRRDKGKRKYHNNSFVLCKNCGIEIEKRLRKVYCSPECKKERSLRNKSDFDRYREACSFKFNVFHYPELFNIEKLKELGWFSALHDNLGGMGRDHRISVSYGFKHNIASWIISHICNCDLVPHKQNNKKHAKCSLTLDQLLERINKY